jgi:biopolymer transport protein ExbD
MPRNRDEGGDTEELDLVPFMNMVVILIPLLLLSVVFMKVGVVNITAPKLSVGPPSKKKPKKKEKPLNLTVSISDKGLRISATGAVLSPQEGCPESGPTICLRKQSENVEQLIKQARSALEQGNKDKGDNILKEASSAYDWMALYNKLMDIKEDYPDETVVNISGDPDIPYALVIRAMDVARYKLKKDSYEDRQEFWEADIRKSESGKGKFARLFSDPVLSIVK